MSVRRNAVYRECMARIADAAYNYLDGEGDLTIEEQRQGSPRCGEWIKAMEAADYCYQIAHPNLI